LGAKVKSTLLRCINGLETFDQGRIVVGNQSVQTAQAESLRALRLNVGMIFQQFNLFDSMTAGENVMRAPRLVRALSPDACRAQAKTLLAREGLADKFDAAPHQHTKRGRQRAFSPWRKRRNCAGFCHCTIHPSTQRSAATRFDRTTARRARQRGLCFSKMKMIVFLVIIFDSSKNWSLLLP